LEVLVGIHPSTLGVIPTGQRAWTEVSRSTGTLLIK